MSDQALRVGNFPSGMIKVEVLILKFWKKLAEQERKKAVVLLLATINLSYPKPRK